ncbi:MAG: sugar phosphate isomerase/epimerase [Candidatus Sumerlaeota bacterium]|nr:sugar phosphate isomerase/epimerase [Candidatus Sumerlaeota bacterium]
MSLKYRLAVFSDEISQDLEKIIEVCKNYSVPGIELRSLWNKGPESLCPAEVKQYRSRVESEGLATCCVAAPFYKCDMADSAAIEKHLDILRRCVDHAHALDAPFVRGFTFWRTGALDGERLRRLADLFEKPIAILEGMDATLAIENEGSTHVGTGKECRRFLDCLNHPRVRSLWDMGNSMSFTEQGTPFPENYEAQKPWMAHVHIKESSLGEDGKVRFHRVGDGQARILDQLWALRDDGYSGWVSLETHWRPVELSEREVNLPGGASYSKDGEFATRACLEVLRRWMKDL